MMKNATIIIYILLTFGPFTLSAHPDIPKEMLDNLYSATSFGQIPILDKFYAFNNRLLNFYLTEEEQEEENKGVYQKAPSLLHQAVFFKNHPSASFLIYKAKAYEAELLSHTNHYGDTPLHTAIALKDYNMLKILLGIDLFETTDYEKLAKKTLTPRSAEKTDGESASPRLTQEEKKRLQKKISFKDKKIWVSEKNLREKVIVKKIDTTQKIYLPIAINEMVFPEILPPASPHPNEEELNARVNNFVINNLHHVMDGHNSIQFKKTMLNFYEYVDKALTVRNKKGLTPLELSQYTHDTKVEEIFEKYLIYKKAVSNITVNPLFIEINFAKLSKNEIKKIAFDLKRQNYLIYSKYSFSDLISTNKLANGNTHLEELTHKTAKFSNRLSSYVVRQVLFTNPSYNNIKANIKLRAKLIENFILLANDSFKCGDFFTPLFILGGLNDFLLSETRLPQTWKTVSPYYLEKFQLLNDYYTGKLRGKLTDNVFLHLDKNFSEKRRNYIGIIPPIGQLITQITNLQDASNQHKTALKEKYELQFPKDKIGDEEKILIQKMIDENMLHFNNEGQKRMQLMFENGKQKTAYIVERPFSTSIVEVIKKTDLVSINGDALPVVEEQSLKLKSEEKQISAD